MFLFGALGLGIMISAMFRTQLMAYQMGTLTSFLPAFLLSGFIYSISQHAADHSGGLAVRAGAVFHGNARGACFLKGIGLRDCCGSICCC